MSSTVAFKAKTKRDRFSAKSLVWPAGIIFFFVSLFYLHQNFFIIRTIICESAGRPCPPSIENLLSVRRGQSVLRLNQRQLKEEVERTGLMNDVEIKMNLPGKLIIAGQSSAVLFYLRSVFSNVKASLSFVESTISGQFAAPSVELSAFVATAAGKTFQLLSTGVLNQADQETNSFLISDSIPSREYLLNAFSWLASLGKAQVKPEALYLLPDMVVVKQKDQPDWLMNFSSPPETTLLTLQRLNPVVTIKKPSLIDFRYANPILK